jgi:hypothetical protein
MDTEERIKSLEKEVMLTVEEVKYILLDIRSFLSEARSPLRGKLGMDKFSLKEDSGKGVEQRGSK